MASNGDPDFEYRLQRRRWIVEAAQRAIEVMGASLRDNMILRACFLMPNAGLAANVLPDYQELAFSPCTLRVGRFILRNLHTGRTAYLQALVAPDVELTAD